MNGALTLHHQQKEYLITVQGIPNYFIHYLNISKAMTTDKNKRALRQQIAASAVSFAIFMLGMTLVALVASQHVKLLAALTTGAIASLGYAGALFIKATSAWFNESRDRGQWTLLDSRFMS